MGRVSDVLRELEDIGALGIPVVSEVSKETRVAAKKLLQPPEPDRVDRTNELAEGLYNRICEFQTFLGSLMEYCESIKGYLETGEPDEAEDIEAAEYSDDEELEASAPEDDLPEDTEEDSEEGLSESSEDQAQASEQDAPASQEESRSEEPKEVEAKAPKDLSAIKAQFFAPDAIVSSRPTNGASVPKSVVDRIAQITKEEEGTDE